MTDSFYLGKLYDMTGAVLQDLPLNYNPDDLTTHAVVTGMTGSGKTGLCIALLEEAALKGIPAILIDPKGDLTNLLLHFPDLAPQDFQPWLDPDLARRAGETLDQAAADVASAWKTGLTEWNISHERMLALRNAADYAIYTPGSDSGLPVSVLTSLEAPGLDWANNREILTERISSTVTALLGLVGLDNIDPLRSREHILLSNIFHTAWSSNRSLDLNELILQIQTPPFDKLGAFPTDTFFPPKDRMVLALQMNNILAAPTFDMWRSGQSLDIKSLLFTANGRPRQSVFYLAHLSDSERMFFVTILLTAIETWMRTQPGTASLRALLYMDEIFGYLPPTAIPPSKPPLLRMLKQARAFGLGLILATQNPVDLDYKALSNAGTWFIGKLQTEQDKQRLLDGLESAAAGALDRTPMDKIISRLGKRIFIMQNVHEKQPIVFQTRWTMNFLAGPLTRAQIPALNALVGLIPPVPPDSSPVQVSPASVSPILATPLVSSAAPPSKPAQLPQKSSLPASATRPSVPAGYAEIFLPMNRSFAKAISKTGSGDVETAQLTGMVYKPALLAQASVRFLDRRYGLNTEVVKSILLSDFDKRGVFHWENYSFSLPDEASLDPAPAPQAHFQPLNGPLADAKQLAAIQKDFADWVYRTTQVVIRSNQTFGLFATPDVSQADFMKACAQAARGERDKELSKAASSYDRQISALQDKIAREDRELQQDETELSERKREELVSGAETVFSLLGGKRSRRISSAMEKHRMTEQSKADVDESIAALEEYRRQVTELEEARRQALEQAASKWGDAVNDITEITIPARKTDVYVKLFGVAWMPLYQVRLASGDVELSAFE
jgi:hypothetical protein